MLYRNSDRAEPIIIREERTLNPRPSFAPRQPAKLEERLDKLRTYANLCMTHSLSPSLSVLVGFWSKVARPIKCAMHEPGKRHERDFPPPHILRSNRWRCLPLNARDTS